MDIYCYKHTAAGLTLVGVVDDFISFNFTRRYADIGEWQLVLDGESLNAQRVRDADFIRAGQGVAGLVQSIEEGKGEQRTLTLTGVELKALANRRIVEPPAGQAYLHYARTPPETVIAGLLQTQLVTPENADRGIAHISVADYAATGYPVTYDGRFQTVGSEIMTLANTYGIGWYADIEDGANIVYHIYRGLDRSEGQSINDRLVISESRDSLQASTYGYTTEIPNWILVAGQGEGVDRELVRIGTSSGLTRSELYRDARDVAQGETELLTQRGNETLASFGDGASYTAEFSAAFAQRYRLDYDLGDICTIKDDALPDGQMDIRLTAITEVYEGDALILSVEFGNAKDSLADAINQAVSGTQGILRAENSAQTLIDLLYPVGAIYMSTNSANPGGYLGGTWETWGAGRVPVGVQPSDTDFNAAGKTGGEKTHTLTAVEMPSHAHGAYGYAEVSDYSGDYKVMGAMAPGGGQYDFNITRDAGGGQAHNNMPPYITCYMWRRTA